MRTATVPRRRTRTPARRASATTPRERDPGTTSPRMTHLQALDGLRGLAVLAVVLYHFVPRAAPGGFLGVDLFFVLSGFLITSLLVRERQSSGGIALSAFWVRRARRLLPALFLVLGAVGVWALTIPRRPVGYHVAVDGLAAFSYVANWHFIASGQSYIEQFLHHAPSPLRHMWSLAIEEQFYFVWPFLLVLVAAVVGRTGRPARRRRAFARAIVVLAAVLGTASVLRMITLFDASNPNRVYYGTDSRAFIILIGAVLGAASAGVPTVPRRLRAVLVGIGCGGVIALGAAVATLSITSAWLYEGGYALVAIVMAIVLAAAAQPGRNPLATALRSRPLVGLGVISYGVYLWHWPIKLWVTKSNTGADGTALFGLRVLLTLVASLASYALVEQPIRRGRLPASLAKRMSLLNASVATAVALPLLVAALTFPSIAAAPKTAPAAAEVIEVTNAYEAAPRCDAPASEPVQPSKNLVVQFEGNSIAGEVIPCLSSILAARGIELVTTHSADFLECTAGPGIDAQIRDKHPIAAVLFIYTANNRKCAQDWRRSIDSLIALYRQNGMHVFLAPSVPFVPGSPRESELANGPLEEAEYYRAVAASNPEHISMLDAGTFLRDGAGVYQWRMPCLPEGEAGCDEQGTVGVRWLDGLHFCTDPDFRANGCGADEFKAGERRVAAAIAEQLLPVLAELQAASG